MPRHSRYNWHELFAKFGDSGLSQAAFCKEHGLNPKYFNLKLSKHRAQQKSVFTQVVVKPESSSSDGFMVEIGQCKIHCPTTMSTPSFVSLVKALA